MRAAAALAPSIRSIWSENARPDIRPSTDLGAHLETLENAGYVTIEKLFVGKRPQTRIKATRAGRRAFAEHVAYLREILDQG